MKQTMRKTKKAKKRFSRNLLWISLLLLLPIFIFSAVYLPAKFFSEAQSTTTTEPNLKVAFIGDTGSINTGKEFEKVLNLIKTEGAQAVVHQGDFDYSFNPRGFDAKVTSVLGANFPYFMSVGNHDDASWNTGCSDADGCYAQFLKDRMARIGAVSDDADFNDQMYATEFKGLKMVFTGLGGVTKPEFAQFVNTQLADDPHVWKICSWHETQEAMQVGSKNNLMGWDIYENCRRHGAIIATAHEHSYHRTKTLTDMTNQIVDPTCADPNNICVDKGRTFAFVSGAGGGGLRNQDRCLPTTYPYGCKQEWAKILTLDQGLVHGALFIVFNYNGDPNKAHAYFKNINGVIMDEFDITTTSAITPTAAQIDPTVDPEITPSVTPLPTMTPEPSPTAIPSPTPTSAPASRTLAPIADTFVHASNPSVNYGTRSTIIADGKPIRITYMKFDLGQFTGKTILSAKLRLKITDASTGTQAIKAVADNAWSETGMIYTNRPALGTVYTSIGSTVKGAWKEVDLTSAVEMNSGTLFSFGIDTVSDDELIFNSRNAGASSRPQLIITYQ